MVFLSEPIDACEHGLLIMSKLVHDKHVTTIQKTNLSMNKDNANSTFTILYWFYLLLFLYSETLIKIYSLRGYWKRWPLAYLKREKSVF